MDGGPPIAQNSPDELARMGTDCYVLANLYLVAGLHGLVAQARYADPTSHPHRRDRANTRRVRLPSLDASIPPRITNCDFRWANLPVEGWPRPVLIVA